LWGLVLKKVDHKINLIKEKKMKIKLRIPNNERYSEAFRRQVVREFELGGITKDGLKDKYQIRGKSTILQWCRKYGRLAYTSTGMRGRPLQDPQQRRIKELERKLKDSQEKILVYEKLIEITNRELGEDVRKKIVTKLSEKWQPKGKG
jgi:transposase